MTTLASYPSQVLGIVRQIIGLRPAFSWIKPSWVMATIQIESSFQPFVVNSTGRQDGLMQVIPSTAAQMQALYNLGPLLPQTDPPTSITCGVCVYDYTARKLVADWGTPSVPLSAVIEAYNEGVAAAEKGLMVSKYWLSWSEAQAIFSSDGVDTLSAIRKMVTPTPMGEG